MKKLSGFFYKFSKVIMMIVGIIAASILVWTSATQMNSEAWADPSKDVKNIVIFSISVGALGLIVIFGFLSIFCTKLTFLSKFGEFIIMTLSFILILGAAVKSGIWLSDKTDWLKFNTAEEKANIAIFSISVIILVMNVVFGIFGGKKAVKEAKEAKKAKANA